MRTFINEYYEIQCIGIIQINQNVYRIKTSEYDYILKFCQFHVNEICHYIDSMNLNCFIQVIKNKYGNYLSCYDCQYCYLMKSVEINRDQYKEEKEIFYYEIMKLFHNKTKYKINVDKESFYKLISHIRNVINERINYYDDLMICYEKDEYRSPSGWMYVLNYYRIYNSLNRAKELLEMIKDIDNVELFVCLIYKNFDLNHISLKNKCLISIDHLSKDLLIYDLYDILNKIIYNHLTINRFIDLYFKHYDFNNYECLLIYCFMCMIPKIDMNQNEINNIMNLSYLLDYIDSVMSFLDKSLTKSTTFDKI